MTYMALAHGITGLGYYSFNERPHGTWRASESNPAYWAQWADLNGELETLSQSLLAPSVEGTVGVEMLEGPGGAGPWGFPALHLSLRRTAEGYFLIAVNGLSQPVRARITLPADPSASQAAVRFENRVLDVNERVIEDAFAPYAVHLYDLPSDRRHQE